ncbi:MacB family efflux pump subunit [Aureimonas frigidaquae]|uniref:MacB family efflux pump subunit n=1 Tax=Aureimonas frigidaquae TaxID=424757 RepID=UPI000782086E|nr:MacB family efflux pump subunit [Aureimonas frigidaquae]
MTASLPTIDGAVAARVRPARLSLSNVGRRFGAAPSEVTVLHDVSLTIEPGEFVAIMGQSGSGKSTLMNILGCLDRPSQGHYAIDGQDVATLSPDALSHLRRDMFGFIFQSYHLIPGSSALRNVELPGIYSGMSAEARASRAEALLSRLGLSERLDHRPAQLSGGQQQRVSIARALMNGGSIILADEPTGALDTASGREVMALLRSLHASGHTVIVITHDRAVAQEAERIIEIRDGRILSDSGAARPVDSPAPARSQAPLPAGAGMSGLSEAARMAGRSLAAQPLRTLLTLLGMMIGVSAVIVMLAIGNGSRQDVVDRISAMGSNQLLVRPGAPGQRTPDGVTATLVPDDARAIAALPNVAAVVPEIQGSVTLRAGAVDYQSTASGTWPDFPDARNWPLATGTFVTQADERSYAPTLVLGRTVADILFPDGRDPVGQYVLVNANPFLVVGTMSQKGASPMGTDQDDIVFVPLSTGGLRLFGQRHLRSISVMVEDTSRIDATQAQIQDLLDARHHVRDTSIRNMASLLDAVSQTASTMTILLGSVAAISLLVGGIGIMNIMLVNVTERTREIGIRMAAGASRGDILRQFNTEAVVVSAIGGGVGCIIGLGVALALRSLGISTAITAGPVLIAFGTAFLSGLVFGYLPARKAARLDPAAALTS